MQPNTRIVQEQYAERSIYRIHIFSLSIHVSAATPAEFGLPTTRGCLFKFWTSLV